MRPRIWNDFIYCIICVVSMILKMGNMCYRDYDEAKLLGGQEISKPESVQGAMMKPKRKIYNYEELVERSKHKLKWPMTQNYN